MKPTRHPLVRDFYWWLKEKLAERFRHGRHSPDLYRDVAVQWLNRQSAPKEEKQLVLKLIGEAHDGSYYVVSPSFDVGEALRDALDIWDPVELPGDLEELLGCFACIPYLLRGEPQTRGTLRKWYLEELWNQSSCVPEHLFDQVAYWLYPNVPGDDEEVQVPDWGDLDAALEILVGAGIISLLSTGQYRFEGAY